MAQGLIGGATSYEEQSLKNIQEDIENWIKYTTDTKAFVVAQKNIVEKSGFWNRIESNFLATIDETIRYFETILHDLDLVRKSIEQNCITEKEVKLLSNIGLKAGEFNRNYGITYNENTCWHDYGNADFRETEKIYQQVRDFFVTMQDANNAAARLEDYTEKGQVINNSLSIQGNVSDSQIQLGTIKSTQTLEVASSFDYDKVLDAIKKIRCSILSEDFDVDFGDNSSQVKKIVDETIKMIEIKEEPTKIKERLSVLKDLAIGVSSGVIANGIYALITQLPIW